MAARDTSTGRLPVLPPANLRFPRGFVVKVELEGPIGSLVWCNLS